MNEIWLPLTEYSSKHRVSISTLRRRIKSEEIKYQLHDGRYLLLDHPLEHRPSLGNVDNKIAPPLKKEAFPQRKASMPFQVSDLEKKSNDEPILTAANRLLTELKKAYSQILQEKEEQIMNLKEEVSDLKTLVRVLESENARVRSK